MKIKPGEIWKMRNGKWVEILKVDAPGRSPIIGYERTSGDSIQWTENGSFFQDEVPSCFDLASPVKKPSPEKTKKKKKRKRKESSRHRWLTSE